MVAGLTKAVVGGSTLCRLTRGAVVVALSRLRRHRRCHIPDEIDWR